MAGTSKGRTEQHRMKSEKRDELPSRVFAFPKQRKEPLTDARHVRNALARFDQVEDVSDTDRAAAFNKIKRAAKRYGIEVPERSWRDLGSKPHTKNPEHRARKR